MFSSSRKGEVLTKLEIMGNSLSLVHTQYVAIPVAYIIFDSGKIHTFTKFSTTTKFSTSIPEVLYILNLLINSVLKFSTCTSTEVNLDPFYSCPLRIPRASPAGGPT